jgi:parvulin-like peptidyl-prolyl isomerase
MILEELVLGLAKEKNVEPTDAQVKERIAEQKKSQPNLAEKLKDMGITEEQFEQLIKVQEAAFNLKTRGVKVTDQEIKDYYEKNKKETFTDREKADVSLILAKSKADADIAVGMLNKGIAFDSVVQQYSVGPKANGGHLPEPVKREVGGPGPSKEMQDAIFSTKDGKITKPIPVGNGTYAIFQVNKVTPAITKSFEDVKSEIKRTLLDQKGSQKNNIEADLAKYREDAKIDIGISRYKETFLPMIGIGGGAAGPEGAPAGDGHNH